MKTYSLFLNTAGNKHLRERRASWVKADMKRRTTGEQVQRTPPVMFWNGPLIKRVGDKNLPPLSTQLELDTFIRAQTLPKKDKLSREAWRGNTKERVKNGQQEDFDMSFCQQRNTLKHRWGAFAAQLLSPVFPDRCQRQDLGVSFSCSIKELSYTITSG